MYDLRGCLNVKKTIIYLSCGCTVLDMPESKEMTQQIDWQGIATITGGLRLGRSEVLRIWRHYLLAQSQGHHTIDRLGVERGVEREEALNDLPCEDDEKRATVKNQTNIGTVSKGNIWETPERRSGARAYGPSRAHRYHL